MTEPLTSARERLQNMVRTDPGNMTVHSDSEVHDALDAYRTEAIAKAIGQLRAVPVQCTALRGPVWYGAGWADAITTLEEVAEYSVPDYEAYPGELVRLRALARGLRAHVRNGSWDRVTGTLHDHSVFERTARAAATEKASTTVPTATPQPETEPIPLRWGLDDVMYGDDDTTTLLLSGPGGEPYELELDPERTTALRDALAGPEQPQDYDGVEPAATRDDASAPPYDVLDGEISITGYPPITLSGWRLTELAPDFYGQAYMQIGGWLPKGWPSEDTPAGTQRMAYAHLHGRAVPRDINVQVESKGFGEPRRFLTIQWRKDGA